MTTITIATISTKDVNTKFGSKKTFSIKGDDGQWYSCGFKKPAANTGDVVTFTFTSNAYGNQIDMGTFVVGGDAGTPATPAVAPKPYERPAYNRNGVFPIEATDGQRSIIRQNALTNAREIVGASMGDVANDDAVAERIIALARHFEAYTAGDIDRMEAQKAAKKAKGKSATPADNSDIPGEE